MKQLVLFFGVAISYFIGYSQETGTFTDARDGKVYKTVKIGTQTWMAENLAYKPSSGKYWFYPGDPENLLKYGYSYNWETAFSVCPSGWHLPSDAEWSTLANYLGDNAGGKLKEAGTTHWNSPNEGGTNSSGFMALPTGVWVKKDSILLSGVSATWWSSTEFSATTAWYRGLINNMEEVIRKKRCK